MTVLTEGKHTGEHLVSEANKTRSREVVTLAEGQNLAAGTVLGKIAAALEASSAAKSGGNTGNGTFVLDPTTPVLASGRVGVYTLRCTAAATNGGTFRLDDPDGVVLTDVTITGGAGGTAAVNEQIKGTLTDGGTDFVVGDGFDITVVEDDDAADIGHYTQFDQDGTNGSQIAVAVLFDNVDATDAAMDAVVHARDCEVNAAELTWPDDIDADEKAAAAAQLASAGIIAR